MVNLHKRIDTDKGYEEKIYTTYAPDTDITFIMKDIIDVFGIEGLDGFVSTECVGWYYGTEDAEATEAAIGKLKAEF